MLLWEKIQGFGKIRFHWRIIAYIFLLNAFVFGLAGWHLYQGKQRAIEDAKREALNTSRALEQSVSDMLEKIEIALINIEEEVAHQIKAGGVDDAQLNFFMKQQQSHLRESFSLRVYDAHGSNTHNAGIMPIWKVNVFDREYFQHLLKYSKVGTYLTPKLITRTNSSEAMVLSRRLNNPDGNFAGVVNCAIDLSNMGWLFSMFDVKKNGSVALVGEDLSLIVRYPENKSEIGLKTPDLSPVQQFIEEKRQYEIFVINSSVDGAQRIISMRKIGNFPVYIAVEVFVEDFLARWRQELLAVLVALVIFLLVTVWMAVQLSANWMKRMELLAKLDRKQKKFRALASMSADWFWEQDENYRFIKVSKDLSDFGFNPIYYPGKARWDLITDKSEEEWIAHRAVLEARQPFYDFEYCVFNDQCERRCMSVSGEPVFDERGRFTGYQGVGRDITEKRQYEERIQQMAQYDPLTNLPNRALFYDRLSQEISAAKRERRTFSLLFFDLDKFKPINDLYGHGVGDQLLQMVASRTRYLLRESDTVARFGGDEFVVLLPPVTSHADSEEVAKKIIAALTSPYKLDGVEGEVSIGVSIGIAMYPQDSTDMDDLVRISDAAMYEAKRVGNCYFFHDGETNCELPPVLHH